MATVYKGFDIALFANHTHTLAGSSEADAMTLTVTDSTTIASGYNNALYISYAQSGAKTGSGQVDALGVDITASAACPYLNNVSLYTATSGNPTIGLGCMISYYQDAVGSGMGQWIGFDQQIASGAAVGAIYSYQRFRNHAGSNAPTSMFYAQANSNSVAATYFIDQAETTIGPVEDSVTAIASGTNTTHRVECRHGATTFYLLGVAAA